MANFHPTPRAAPSPFPGGSGAKLDTTTVLRTDFALKETDFMTLAFWTYLIGAVEGATLEMLSVGASFRLLLEPKNRTLEAHFLDETVTQMGRLPFRRWTHVAVTYRDGEAAIFVNGIRDAVRRLKSRSVTGRPALGSVSSAGGVEAYVDDLRLYDVALNPEEVWSLSPSSITGIPSPTSIVLGSLECGWHEAHAAAFCDEGRSLCSAEVFIDVHWIRHAAQQLAKEGFHLARIQGWMRSARSFWRHDETETPGDHDDIRAALC
eukprot:Polyplicarium_translucidae@DN5184_c0_g1_i1.p1